MGKTPLIFPFLAEDNDGKIAFYSSQIVPKRFRNLNVLEVIKKYL